MPPKAARAQRQAVLQIRRAQPSFKQATARNHDDGAQSAHAEAVVGVDFFGNQQGFERTKQQDSGFYHHPPNRQAAQIIGNVGHIRAHHARHVVGCGAVCAAGESGVIHVEAD